MLQQIIAFSIKNKLLIGLFTIGLVAIGIYEFKRLPIDAVPDITDNQVLVITQAPAYGATDIERLITFPIEQANTNIPGLKEIRSFSRFGLSLVTIIFDDATDVYWARQQVSERLISVQQELPPGMGKPELGPVSTGLGEIYQYAVRPKKGYEQKFDPIELRSIQDWIIRRQLVSVEGVAEVSSFGGRLKQYHILVDPYKLQSYGVSISDVFTALEKNNQNTGGSYIEKGPTAIFIRTEGLITDFNEIKNIRINPGEVNTPVFIRDIAEIKRGYATRFGAMQYNDEGEVAGAIVMMLKGANSSQVIKNIKSRISEIEKTLPEGVIIEPFLDRTKMVNNAISTVKTNLIEGALIVVLILVLFLGNLRAGVLVASVIPLSLLFAVIMMNAFGVSGNLMSLGALDFGLIVDGAIIIVEAVMHRLYMHINPQVSYMNQTQMDTEVKESTTKMMKSAVFGQLIILIVYIPIFSLQGIEGKMFKPMAQTVAFSLLGAFILSLTYVPMMSSVLLSKKLKTDMSLSDKIMQKMEYGFAALLSKVLKVPVLIIGAAFTLFLSAFIVLSRMGGEFIPALEEGDFAVDTRVLNGSNINTTLEYTSKAAGLLKKRYQEVEKVVTKVGAGEVATDPMSMEASDMMVILKDKKEWTNAKTFDELAEKMGNTLSEIPGLTFGFQYPVQMRFNELMTGAKQDVVCKIFGENLDTLSFYADKLGQIIKTVPGAEELFIEPVTGRSQIVIQFNRAMISQYGLDVEEINKIINMAFAGQAAGKVYEGEKRFDIIVKTKIDDKDQIRFIENLLINLPDGKQMPLKNFAHINTVMGPNQIQREDAKRRIVVGFNVGDRDVQSIVEELQNKVSASLRLPSGYYITYGGTFENIQAAKSRLLIAVPLSLLLIFILLYFAFKSIKHGILIYTAIPLSAIGGIFLLSFRGMPFSISAGIGFIALFGVSVLNGIVLISEFNRLKSTSNDMNITQIILQGARNRLRPVLMTASVASLGFLPMALSHGAGAEVQRPLATVVIGGLIVATFLTLLVLPVLYLLFEKINKKVVVAPVMIVCCLWAFHGDAQTKMEVSDLLNKAFIQNASIKLDELKSDYYSKLMHTVAPAPSTLLGLAYGEINSAYKDNALSITQNINNPKYVKSYKDLLNQQAKTSILSVDLRKAEITKYVYHAFYNMVDGNEKLKLLKSVDSSLAQIEAFQKLRLQAGEATKMHLFSATTERLKIQLHQREVEKNIGHAEVLLNGFINEQLKILPIYINPILTINEVLDPSTLTNHPTLRILSQKQAEGEAQVKLDESELLPNFGFSLYSTSMKGTGSNDVTYSKWPRFNSLQFNLEMPIFNKSRKAKIEASKMHLDVLQSELNTEAKLLQNRLTSLVSIYQNLQSTLDEYNQKILPVLNETSSLSSTQLAAGDINTIDWLFLHNQSFETKWNYLNTIHELNQTIIEIKYLISK